MRAHDRWTTGRRSTRRRILVITSLIASLTVAASVSPAASESPPPAARAVTEDVVHLYGDHVVRYDDGTTQVVPEPTPWETSLSRSQGLLDSSTEGFFSWNDLVGNVGGYTIHLVSSSEVESLRTGLQQVAGELASITGKSFTVSPGLRPTPTPADKPTPADNEIHVVVSATTPCDAVVIGCGQINFRNGIGMKGTVWITPSGMGLDLERRISLLRHEVGHVLGLRHYQSSFEGNRQVMASALWDPEPYRSGDRNGIRFLDPTCRNRPADVPSSNRFCDEIAWNVRNGVVSGWPDGTFRPANPISRQAMAVMLHRYAGSPPVTGSTGILDLPDHPEFADAITWMVSEGIAMGDTDGRFRPTDPVSRQAMAAFIHRLLSWANPSMGVAPPGQRFNDVPVGHRFEVEINSLAYLDVVQGNWTGESPRGWVFGTTSPVTRQAVAAFIFRSDNL